MPSLILKGYRWKIVYLTGPAELGVSIVEEEKLRTSTTKFMICLLGFNNAPLSFHGVNEPGVRVTREDDRGVTEGRGDVREVFQQHESGAKMKLSRCGKNQMGNEPILALPEGANDFVVYYDMRSKGLEVYLVEERV
ncbi:hypothetical protein Tco_0378425 [Tanacetum coccineum]